MLTHRQTHTGFLIYTVYKRRGGEREREREERGKRKRKRKMRSGGEGEEE